MKRQIFFIFVLLLAFVASGCAVLQTEDTGGMVMTYDDDEIRSSITAALLKEDASQANTLTVYTFNSHVFLIGKGSQEFRSFARNTASKTKGVKEVYTHWFEDDAGNKMQDAILAADIDSEIFLDKKLSSTRMALEVVDGHVVMCGAMPDKESVERIISTARSVDGVKSVTSYLIY